MKRLIFALPVALLAAASAEASVRYDFTGNLTADFVGGSAGSTLVAESGLDTGGAFSGFAVFDEGGPDVNPDPNLETYLPSSFGLTLGSYNFPTGPDSYFANVDPLIPDFQLTLLSAGDFSALDGEFLSLSINFPAAVSGILQSPVAGDAIIDFTITGGDDSIVFGTGTLTTIQVTSAPIPEPATWALMILGLGLTGAALRRRAKSVAFGVN